MSVVIKTVFDGNIHKFSLTQPSYDELEQVVNSIYGKRGFSFRYQDEDGDLVTISSTPELQEAIKVTQHKGLKLILTKDKDDFVCVDSPVRVHQQIKEEPKAPVKEQVKEPTEEPKEPAKEQPKPAEASPKKTKAQEFWEAEEVREAAERAKQAQEQPRAESKESKDCELSCEEARVAVYQLLTDPAVQLVLPELTKAVLTKFVQEAQESKADRSDSAARVLDVVTQHSVLKDHAAMQTLRPYLPKVHSCLTRLLGALPREILALLDQAKDTMQISAESLLSLATNPFGAGLDLGRVNFGGLAALAPMLGWFGCGPVEFGFDCAEEGKSSPPSGEAVHSNIRCDVCNVFPIVGPRFQCTVCPDFDLCAKCEATPNSHPPEHVLVKHRQPAQVVHEGITCDGCQQSPITGIRFKCRVCPDYDLCSSCEAKNIHPADHPLIKFKVPRSREGRWGGCRRMGQGIEHPFRGILHGVFRELHGRRWGRGDRWIAQGSVGDAVKEVQQALGVPADGFFGPQTEEAVKKYQKEQDLPVDGIVGPRTRAKLFPGNEPDHGCHRRWLAQGSVGDVVKEVQKALGVPVDGFFGPQTEEAVKKFQTEQGLPVDGVVGPRTRHRLFPAAEGESRCHRRWLAQGAVGDAVKEVQKALGVPVDGVFGPRTEEAVKKFQTEQGIPVDGVVGPRTRHRMFPESRCHRRWLTRGSEGDAVKEVQKALGVPVDGVFGSQTEEAVKKFQTEQGILVDGVVGPFTRAKLFPSVEEKTASAEASPDRDTPERAYWRRRCLARDAVGDALKGVQQVLGVPADGVLGSQTAEAVRKFLVGDAEPQPAPKAEPEKKDAVDKKEQPWLRPGSVGESVKEVQRALGVAIDGVFGRLTERAVREFQFAHDLAVDGIVGPTTWAKLTSGTPANGPMQALINMGFNNVELNARLLRQFNGDVDQVVAAILGQ